MSLQPTPIGPVPEETVRVAHAAFPTGNMYVQLRDHVGRVYEDASFSSLFPSRGQPAEAPWRLAIVTRQVIHPGMFKEFTREAGMGLENGADANLSVGG